MEQVARQTSQIRRQNQTVAEHQRVQNGGRHDLRWRLGNVWVVPLHAQRKTKLEGEKRKKYKEKFNDDDSISNLFTRL
jgi:hypothetical protein